MYQLVDSLQTCHFYRVQTQLQQSVSIYQESGITAAVMEIGGEVQALHDAD